MNISPPSTFLVSAAGGRMIARHGAVLALGKVDFLAHQQQLNDTLDLLFSNVSTAKVRPHTYNQAPTPG